jgi:hypothetical protein
MKITKIGLTILGGRAAWLQRQLIFRRVVSVLALMFATIVVAAEQAAADPDDQFQQILPFPTINVSTIPSNGDVNPYGVAFVPNGFPAGGLLEPGDLLVSNFNNSQNLQGTGTTIIKVAPNGQTSLFFQGTAPLGLSTGLAVLKAGFVLVANCPTNGQPPVPGALPGSLMLINRNGTLVQTFFSDAIQGPWDFTVYDQGRKVTVFVSNAITGTVTRIELVLSGPIFAMTSAAVIASGYTHHADPATFEVAPTGLAFDPTKNILYVASTGDNAVFEVKDAFNRHASGGPGRLVYADKVHLHGALAMVMAPNGHLLVSNSDEFNPDPNQPSEIVEFTVSGRFIGELSVDPNLGGAFGLNITNDTDDQVRFAAVDDNANTITIWKLNTASLTDSGNK